MPLFDRRCESCGWTRADCYEPVVFERACDSCGKPTVREWSAPAVHGDDSFIGGKVIENLGHHPVTVYSRQELKREMDKRGLRPMVRHVGEQGSDRSKHTSKWV